MEAEPATPETKASLLQRFRLRIRGKKARIYYWPIRTVVQLGFFVLFAGAAVMRLNPAFNGTRVWVALPVLSSVKAQGTIGSTLDTTTLLLKQAAFPWLPLGMGP